MKCAATKIATIPRPVVVVVVIVVVVMVVVVVVVVVMVVDVVVLVFVLRRLSCREVTKLNAAHVVI